MRPGRKRTEVQIKFSEDWKNAICTSHDINVFVYTSTGEFKEKIVWQRTTPKPRGILHYAKWLGPLIHSSDGSVNIIADVDDLTSTKVHYVQGSFYTNDENYYVRNSTDKNMSLVYTWSISKQKDTIGWLSDIGYVTVHRGDLSRDKSAEFLITFNILNSSYDAHGFGDRPKVINTRYISTSQLWDFHRRANLKYPIMNASDVFGDDFPDVFPKTSVSPVTVSSPIIPLPALAPSSASVPAPIPMTQPTAQPIPITQPSIQQPIAQPVIQSAVQPIVQVSPNAPGAVVSAPRYLSPGAEITEEQMMQLTPGGIPPPSPAVPVTVPVTAPSPASIATSMVVESSAPGVNADISHNDIIALLTKFVNSDVVAPDFFVTQDNDAFYPPNKLMDLYREGTMKLKHLQTIDDSILELLTKYTIHRFVMFLDKDQINTDMNTIPDDIRANIISQLAASGGGPSSIVANFIKTCNARVNVDIGTINSTMQADDDLQRIVDLGEEILSEDVYNPVNRQSADVFTAGIKNVATVTNFRQTMFANKGEVSFMKLNPREEIPKEIHMNADQIIVPYDGSVTVTISKPIDVSNDTSVEALQDLPTKSYEVLASDIIVIPSNRYHTVKAGPNGCKLASIYTRAYHKKGTVHQTRTDSQE